MTTTERVRIDFPSRIGVWWASDSWAMPAAQAVARDIEAMGYGSLFLPETNKPQIVAFHRSAIAFVSQIQKTEAMRADNKFADRLRGLHVYGSKVVRPSAVVSWTAA